MLLATLVLILVAAANAGSRAVIVPCSQTYPAPFVVADTSGTLCGALFAQVQCSKVIVCSDSHGPIVYGGTAYLGSTIVAPIPIVTSFPSQGIDFIGGLNCTQCADINCQPQYSTFLSSVMYLKTGLLC